MQFEYDPLKSDSNREKHGIDFEKAKELWNDSRHLIVPAKSSTEERFAIIAGYRGKIWNRIISVRRARDGEKKGYYQR